VFSESALSLMPRPGDPPPNAFIAEVGQCWWMIHDRQRQATHCLRRQTGLGDGSPIRRPMAAGGGLSRAPTGADGAAGVRNADWGPETSAALALLERFPIEDDGVNGR
jgi:hypothetical protein